jgi:hypothetical protein
VTPLSFFKKPPAMRGDLIKFLLPYSFFFFGKGIRTNYEKWISPRGTGGLLEFIRVEL